MNLLYCFDSHLCRSAVYFSYFYIIFLEKLVEMIFLIRFNVVNIHFIRRTFLYWVLKLWQFIFMHISKAYAFLLWAKIDSLCHFTIFKLIVLGTSFGKPPCSEEYYEEAVLRGIQYSTPVANSTQSLCQIFLLGMNLVLCCSWWQIQYAILKCCY